MEQLAGLKHWKLVTDAHGILWCHLDQQGSTANVLSAEVLSEFGRIIEAVEQETPRGMIILSAKAGGFIAGADVAEFTRITERKQALAVIHRVHDLFNRLEKINCPTLALIHGYCLGGGLELALACRYRVALDEPGTRLGLPEVQLGIHPGFGGSLRMPRVAGAIAALRCMLQGRSLDARQAGKIGLVDRCVPRRQFRNAATAMIVEQPRAQRPGWRRQLAGHPLCRPVVAKIFRRELVRRVARNHYPAPYALLDLWQNYAGDDQGMLMHEAESVADLLVSDTSRNLVRLFQLRERLKAGGTDRDASPPRVHVIGAGVMGGDIAAWCVLQGCTVTLQDRDAAYIAPAVARAHALFQKQLRTGTRITAAMDRLLPDTAGYGIRRAGIVIEAISENLEAKRTLMQTIETQVDARALLATNTSSIPLDEIGRDLVRPERLVGIHFFNPVARMQLIEVVHSGRTSPESIAAAAAFCRRIDRLPLPVKSAPGFLVNRVLTPYLLEAVALIDEGIPAHQVDAAAVAFGMPMGPVELADSVGLDICLSVAENLSASMKLSVPDGLRHMVAAGRLGRKSGHGYYRYRRGKALKPAQNSAYRPAADLEDRLVLRIINECVACLREGIVSDPDQVDAAVVFGAGFAPFRGGPLWYARQSGYTGMLERLAALETRYGARFTPDPGWNTLGRTGV